ncbi:MAG: 50S ribosomal protein L21 [Methylobacteriaceae bacterium]|jgi:large subunit ribosomal protein L21|nr:50S ribosomal protein L21 [Methylobacteriaceae bacterium]
MFAVIKSGGKQYKVANNDVIRIARVDREPGAEVVFDQVTMVSDGTSVTVGAPLVEGLTVTAEVVEQVRGDKVIAFKKRRRQNSRRTRGHRQEFTVVRITAVGDEKAERPEEDAAAEESVVAETAGAEAAAANEPAEPAEISAPAADET